MKRSKFSLSGYNLASCEMGHLVPIGLTEVLPGDTIRQDTQCLIRFSPMAAPVMHPIVARVHSFFVPHRLVFPEWEDFITGGKDGNDDTTLPTVSSAIQAGSIPNHYGIGITNEEITYSALPLMGYSKIYDEYYLDQDLQAGTPPGFVPDGTIQPYNIAWEKDYFTTARPWAQKGNEISIPLADSAPVVSDGNTPVVVTGGPLQIGGDPGGTHVETTSVAGGGTDFEWIQTGMQADLSAASGITPRELREYLALQRYQEARARYGSRFTEYLRYLGVTPSDARLQRPEYLGGGRAMVQISEVLQTAPENQGGGQATEYGVGDMYGHGIAAIGGRPWQRFFEEHGYVHTFISVRPKALYTQGMSRHWLKRDKEDYWQKELQHVGQQEVWDGEVYNDVADPYSVFGYTDRYREYREGNCHVAGEFATTLKYWHLAREFEEPPVLNNSFVACEPSKRIFGTQDENPLYIMSRHSIKARRLVSRNASGRML